MELLKEITIRILSLNKETNSIYCTCKKSLMSKQYKHITSIDDCVVGIIFM